MLCEGFQSRQITQNRRVRNHYDDTTQAGATWPPTCYAILHLETPRLEREAQDSKEPDTSDGYWPYFVDHALLPELPS